MKADPVEANHRLQHQYPRNVRYCPLCGGELAPRVILPDRKEHKSLPAMRLRVFHRSQAGRRMPRRRRRSRPAAAPRYRAFARQVDLPRRLRRLRRDAASVRGARDRRGSRDEREGRRAARNLHRPARSGRVVVVYAAMPGVEAPGLSPEAIEVRYFQRGRDPVGRSRLRHHHAGA